MIESISLYLASNHNVVTAAAAVIALVISICTIILTICTMTMQRTHNRKSVVPIAYVTVGDYENHTYVRLRNMGVGPMVVTGLKIIPSSPNSTTGSALIDFMPQLPEGYFWIDFVEDLSERAISAGDQITLVEISGKTSDRRYLKIRKSVRDKLAELTVVVEYKNVFDDKMPTFVRKLDWFARKT